MSDNLETARRWVEKARHDLLDADNNLASSHVPFDMVCFHCQQAAEKLLKACCAYYGEHPPKTHDLLFLLASIEPLYPSAPMLRDAVVLLSPYAVGVRYPDSAFEMSREDATEARDAAQAVLDWLCTVTAEIV
jgi:HEPN domain-containing protein